MKRNNLPKKVVHRVLAPIESFLALEAASGILLGFATIVALFWANSPWSGSYEHLLHMHLGFHLGDFHLGKSLHHWVNDGLMVIFFFVVGLEIKKEVTQGELATPQQAALPLFAALGGVMIPALIYTAINATPTGVSYGWGIPMATDIAFALGILSLLGNRVPFALKVFLLALAIIDDLAAVLVIAFFYTEEISTQALGFAGLAITATVFFRIVGVRKVSLYVLVGLCVWFGILKSGVHATIAGVILGFITPSLPLFNSFDFSEKFKKLSKKIQDKLLFNLPAKEHEEALEDIPLPNSFAYEVEKLGTESVSPLDRLIHILHPWVSFVIMPLFALFNAGVKFGDVSLSAVMSTPLSLGIILGLVIGKPVGIFCFSLLAVKFNFASLPKGVSWKQVLGVGFLGGVGFTMALFIGNLALGEGSSSENLAKLAILIASVIASIAGVIFLILGTEKTSKV